MLSGRSRTLMCVWSEYHSAYKYCAIARLDRHARRASARFRQDTRARFGAYESWTRRWLTWRVPLECTTKMAACRLRLFAEFSSRTWHVRALRAREQNKGQNKGRRALEEKARRQNERSRPGTTMKALTLSEKVEFFG